MLCSGISIRQRTSDVFLIFHMWRALTGGKSCHAERRASELLKETAEQREQAYIFKASCWHRNVVVPVVALNGLVGFFDLKMSANYLILFVTVAEVDHRLFET